MHRLLRNLLLFTIAVLALLSGSGHATTSTAADRVKAAIDYWRGTTSYTIARMRIQRPDWSRESEFESWTEGDDKSLVRFTAPAKDAGSASLKVEQNMWSYAPKINKVIKIPPSMMAQSWMGSDFSYNDLAKADNIVRHYTHTQIGESMHEGVPLALIEAVPHEGAPVVWGKEILHIRADHIIIMHEYYDQDMKLVKRLDARDIQEIGGKLFARLIRMSSLEESNKWTEVEHLEVEFDKKLPASLFTRSNLQNPRMRR